MVINNPLVPELSAPPLRSRERPKCSFHPVLSPNRKTPAWEDFIPLLEVWARAVGFPLDKLGALAVKIRRDGFPGRYPFRKAYNVVTQFRMQGIVDRIFKGAR
jgi:hypothetical protein